MSTKNCIVRTISLVAAFLICVSLFSVAAIPASASSLSGDWEKAKIENMNVYGLVFDTPVRNCSSFDLEADITMNANAYCTDWQIWLRINGTYTKISTLYLADGTGWVSKTVKLNPARNFDAIAITPKKQGNYSWTIGIDVSNVVSSSGSDSNTSSSHSTPDNIIPGDWNSVKIKDGNNTYTVGAFEFASPLRKVVELTIEMDVNMLHNTSCKDWQIWIGSNGSFSKIDTLYLASGNGDTTKTIRFKNPRSFDSIAITPKKSGSFSWEMDLAVYDVIYK